LEDIKICIKWLRSKLDFSIEKTFQFLELNDLILKIQIAAAERERERFNISLISCIKRKSIVFRNKRKAYVPKYLVPNGDFFYKIQN
jgi:hypothetical protein